MVGAEHLGFGMSQQELSDSQILSIQLCTPGHDDLQLGTRLVVRSPRALALSDLTQASHFLSRQQQKLGTPFHRRVLAVCGVQQPRFQPELVSAQVNEKVTALAPDVVPKTRSLGRSEAVARWSVAYDIPIAWTHSPSRKPHDQPCVNSKITEERLPKLGVPKAVGPELGARRDGHPHHDTGDAAYRDLQRRAG
jgi:hypothetical protein